jgi:Transposase DDE domain
MNCCQAISACARSKWFCICLSAKHVQENNRWTRSRLCPNFRRVLQGLCAANVDVICLTQPGFQVLPKRWIVERTFAWWNQYRRLSKGYEFLPKMSESMIDAVMIRLMLKQLATPQLAAS